MWEKSLGCYRAKQKDNRRDRPAGEIGGHLLAAYGWKIEREKGIIGHGGVALSLLRQKSGRKRISTRIQRVIAPGKALERGMK